MCQASHSAGALAVNYAARTSGSFGPFSPVPNCLMCASERQSAGEGLYCDSP